MQWYHYIAGAFSMVVAWVVGYVFGLVLGTQ